MRLAPCFGSLVFAGALCGTPVSAQTPSPPAPAETQAQVSPAIQQRQVLSGDPSVAPRIDNAPIDPELKGFIDLPGTRTKLKVGGNAKLDVIHDFQPAGESDAFLTSAIPVGDTTGADNTSVSVRQSRIGLELRRPTPRGDLRIVYENDFFDFTTGETQFNLRHFYGQVANVLAGFTYSTLMDVDSLPDTLDYQGPGAMVFVLQPVIRYSLGLDAEKKHTGSRQFFEEDYLLFQGNYGKGMGRYIEDVAGLAPDVGVEDGRLTANDAGSFFVAYQHSWSEALRSTALFGSAWVDSVGRILTTDFNKSRYTSANVIWNPKDTSLNIGVEYLYGWQKLKTGEEGHANRVQVSFQYDLVR